MVAWGWRSSTHCRRSQDITRGPQKYPILRGAPIAFARSLRGMLVGGEPVEDSVSMPKR
jgi:hypothetical protein